MVGNKNSGRRNPDGTRGNPNIGEISKAMATGPKSDMGKFKMLATSGTMAKMKRYSQSRLFNKFRKCNICPLRPRVEERLINGKTKQISIAGKCPHYQKGHKCVVAPKDFAKEIEFYFKNGFDKEDMLAVQKAVIFRTLENAEKAKEVEVLTQGRPGYYSAEFSKIAMDGIDKHNKVIMPQKIQSENKNLNIDITAEALKRYEKDKEDKEKEDET